MNRYQRLEDQELSFTRRANLRYHARTLQFNLSDTAQYLLSLIHLQQHMGWSDHPVTDMTTTSDKIGLAIILLGSACTLISNQYAYFLLNRKMDEGELPPSQKIKLEGWKKYVLGGVVFISVSNKSFATASSFAALQGDYGVPSTVKYTNFGLALISHFLAQSSVQGITGDWHVDFGRCARAASMLSAIYYTLSLLGLNWNSIYNVFKTFGVLDERPAFDSRTGLIILMVSAPFFLPALLRTPVVYFHRKMNCLLPEEEAERIEKQRQNEAEAEQLSGRISCYTRFQQVTGGLATLQRSGMMLLSLSAILYPLSDEPGVAIFLAVAGCLFAAWGTWKSNAAVLYPNYMSLWDSSSAINSNGAVANTNLPLNGF